MFPICTSAFILAKSVSNWESQSSDRQCPCYVRENEKELPYLEKKNVILVITIRKAHIIYNMNHKLELAMFFSPYIVLSLNEPCKQTGKRRKFSIEIKYFILKN